MNVHKSSSSHIDCHRRLHRFVITRSNWSSCTALPELFKPPCSGWNPRWLALLSCCDTTTNDCADETCIDTILLCGTLWANGKHNQSSAIITTVLQVCKLSFSLIGIDYLHCRERKRVTWGSPDGYLKQKATDWISIIKPNTAKSLELISAWPAMTPMKQQLIMQFEAPVFQVKLRRTTCWYFSGRSPTL